MSIATPFIVGIGRSGGMFDSWRMLDHARMLNCIESLHHSSKRWVIAEVNDKSPSKLKFSKSPSRQVLEVIGYHLQ